MLRTSGRHTVGRVIEAWPGWVRVEVTPEGATKDVPEGEVYRLHRGLRFDAAAHPEGFCKPHPTLALGTRTVVLGQDAGGLPAVAGLTHSDFRSGEPVRTRHAYPPLFKPQTSPSITSPGNARELD